MRFACYADERTQVSLDNFFHKHLKKIKKEEIQVK